MPDITLCTSEFCPKREMCYRAQAESDVYQSWSNFEYTYNEDYGFCDFVPIRNYGES